MHRLVLSESSAPLTFDLTPASWASAGIRRTPSVATELFPPFVPNVWSHLSVKQEGLGSPSSPLGSFRYFRELHFSLCGCLDRAAAPTAGLLEVSGLHLLQAWGPSIINGATRHRWLLRYSALARALASGSPRLAESKKINKWRELLSFAAPCKTIHTFFTIYDVTTHKL